MVRRKKRTAAWGPFQAFQVTLPCSLAPGDAQVIRCSPSLDTSTCAQKATVLGSELVSPAKSEMHLARLPEQHKRKYPVDRTWQNHQSPGCLDHFSFFSLLVLAHFVPNAVSPFFTCIRAGLDTMTKNKVDKSLSHNECGWKTQAKQGSSEHSWMWTLGEIQSLIRNGSLGGDP